jgi:hypothetical protein
MTKRKDVIAPDSRTVDALQAQTQVLQALGDAHRLEHPRNEHPPERAAKTPPADRGECPGIWSYATSVSG